MTDPSSFVADWGVEELRSALSHAALEAFEAGGDVEPSAEARAAAWQLALALGRCRVFGVEPGEELDGSLPPPIAAAAATDMVDLLEDLIARARGVEALLDADPSEAQEEALQLLEARMAVFAAHAALNETLALQFDQVQHEGFATACDRFLEVLAQFDDALRQIADVVAGAADLPLLDNWRSLLAPSFQELLPWWLSGELEEVRDQLAAEARRGLAGVPRGSAERDEVAARITDWLPMQVAPAMAAREHPSIQQPWWKGRWQQLAGRYAASLAVPATGAATLEVVFVNAAGDRTEDLDGTRAELGGVGATIEGGEALFPVAVVRAAAACHPQLVVGGVLWPLAEVQGRAV